MSRLKQPQQHDDLLNFQLKRLLALGGAPAIRLCEGRYGIARLEWRLIAALAEGGAMSPTALVADTGLEQARVSQVIGKLVGKGLVERCGQPGDRRRVLLGVTPTGRDLYAELFPQLAAINRRIMEALDEDEAQVLERCLRRLTCRAQAIAAEGGGVAVRADRRLGGSRRFWG